MTVAATVYVVVEFTHPEFENDGEFDSIIGVYTSQEDAEREAADHKMRFVYEARLDACRCRKFARCADCMERDRLAQTSSRGGLVSWLVQGAFGGRGIFPFNLYRWNSDE